jgi:hypothetical protein
MEVVGLEGKTRVEYETNAVNIEATRDASLLRFHNEIALGQIWF